MSTEDTTPDVPENEGLEEATEDAQEGASEKTDDDTSSVLDAADRDELLKEIVKLRRENGKRRIKNKEIEEAAANWQTHLDAQKSEMDKLIEANALLKTQVDEFNLDKMRQSVAKEYGLDPDLADLLVGSDEDEMKDRAERLATKLQALAKKPTAADLGAGRDRGKPVKTKSTNEWFGELMKGND